MEPSATLVDIEFAPSRPLYPLCRSCPLWLAYRANRTEITTGPTVPVVLRSIRSGILVGLSETVILRSIRTAIRPGLAGPEPRDNGHPPTHGGRREIGRPFRESIAAPGTAGTTGVSTT